MRGNTGRRRMAQVKKANVPPTHPSVYVGLALSAVGLLLAMYAYTGTRVYDVLYALVALLGALVAVAGILTAAWGRAIMASRAARARRATRVPVKGEPTPAPADEEAPPTVAAPPSKKRFALPRPPVGAAASLFRRRAEAPAGGAAVALERVTVQCPRCDKQFSQEGARPMTLTCPSCGFTETV